MISRFTRSAAIFGLLFFFAAESEAAPKKPMMDVAPGFADLHNHLFAHLGFGGGWIHGEVDGPEAEALRSCDSEAKWYGHREKHGTTSLPFINSLIGRLPGGIGDTGNHEGRRDGYPTYKTWPRWDTIAHQQQWIGWLKMARARGLTFIVLSAVNFEPLCKVIPKENRRFGCDDMEAVDRQFAAAEELARKHDWFVIVRTPKEARTAIAAGKLAVMLSIEASFIFGNTPVLEALDRYEAKGVRTLQLAHQLNNRFAGAAIHNPLFRVFQVLLDAGKVPSWKDLRPSRIGFQMNDEKHNLQGLTDEGRILVTEMMKRGMLIDLAHLSEKTVADIEEISKSRGDYPVYVSHGHFRDIMDDGKFSVWEKSSAGATIEFVRRTEGVFGLRTGPERTKKFEGHSVPNDCQGSSKSFAQAYGFGALKEKLNIALGTDLNGFIQQTRPRFGGNDETCGAEVNPKERKRQREAQSNPLGKNFDRSGFGRIDESADLIQELKNFGLDVSNVESSTEKFLKLWEKSVALAKKTP